MKRPKNEPIGEVPCPVRDCTETAKVFRFRQRTEGRVPVYAGKVYADCPVHGRYGVDGRPAAQEYILQKGTIWGANDPPKPAAEPAPKPTPAPASKPATPAPKTPASPAPDPAKPKERPWWKPILD